MESPEDRIDRLISDELLRQNQIWGVRVHTFPEWATILGEEYGELCQAILKYHFGKKTDRIKEVIKKAVHVATISKQILIHIERCGFMEEK